MRYVWLITCALLFAHSAYAGGDDEAKRLFEEGRARAKEGKYAEACELFGKSLAIERKIVTELNLGECNEHLVGHLREAWGMYLAGAGDAAVSGNAKTATFGRERAAALEPQMTIVIVKVAQPKLNNLLITIGGRATQPIAEIHERADPGDIEVIATAPGLPQVKLTKPGVAGGETTFEIPVMDAKAPIEVTEKPIAIDGPRSASRVRVAYVVGSVGAASAITAITLTVIARIHYDNIINGPDCVKVPAGSSCNDAGTAAIHDAQHLTSFATGFSIGGVALLGTAAIVFLTAPRDQIFVRPQASAHGAGVVIGGSF